MVCRNIGNEISGKIRSNYMVTDFYFHFYYIAIFDNAGDGSNADTAS